MVGPPAIAPAFTSTSVSPAPSRRSSARLGQRRGGDHQQPPPTSPLSSAAVSPAGMSLRRSVRIHVHARVRGLSSAAPLSERRRRMSPKPPPSPRATLHAAAEQWSNGKAQSGAPEEECVLPFLQKGAPRKVECLICSKSILPDERTQCSAHHCEVTLHKICSEKRNGSCPRHICFYCKRRTSLHRLNHIMPACTKCSLKQNRMVDFVDPSNTMISWSIWPSTSEVDIILHPPCIFFRETTFLLRNCVDAGPAHDIEEALRRLPLPYTDQEFNIYPIKKEELENETEPPPYVHLKHNVYLVKKKRDGDAIEGGCTNCDPPLTCQIRCSCRSVLISCSRACHCSSNCTNRPFRREKRVQIVKTQHCGWGAIALETIGEGDFVIEFVGEVIDGLTCEERLKDTKRRGDKNFYMCKVSDDFVIDATFRGNACRFFNHSCKPNCQLENWQVNGKTRLGVFASRAIEVGEPLTYNYRFKQRFGPQIECLCGAANCNGNL